MAHVFMCPGKFDKKGWLQCKTWNPHAGANAVIVQGNSNRVIVSDHVAEYPDYSVTLECVREALIDTTDYEIEEGLRQTVFESTKIGGVPFWLQANETPACPACGGSMKFVAQFAAELDGPLPADPREWDDEKYKFFHFGGDDGIGYLFLCENECGPNGAVFLWQYT